MSRSARALFVAVLIGGTFAVPPASEASQNDAVRLDVAFRVENVNRSQVPCPGDGESYTVRGHLTAPASVLRTRRAPRVSLYLHGFAITEASWTFDALPGYDHAAEMAALGHVSVSIERIGWDPPRPHGAMTCTGTAADVAHQIVRRLRAGAYRMEATDPIAFSRVVLVGHDTAGGVAQAQAYSFRDIDGLVVIGYHNQGITAEARGVFADAMARCARGGEDAESDAPGGGYVPPPQFIREKGFHDADPAIADAVVALAEKNPCGENASAATEFFLGPSKLSEVSVPVLLLQAEHDNVFDPATAERQKDHYPDPDKVTFHMLKGTGHFPMFERTAPRFRALLSDWLSSIR